MNCTNYFINNGKMVLPVKRQNVSERLWLNSYVKRMDLHKNGYPFLTM